MLQRLRLALLLRGLRLVVLRRRLRLVVLLGRLRLTHPKMLLLLRRSVLKILGP